MVRGRGKYAGKSVFAGVGARPDAERRPRPAREQVALPLAGDEDWVRHVGGDERNVSGGIFVISPDGEIQYGTTGVVCFIPRREHDTTWVLYEPVPMTAAQQETLERLYSGWRPW